jgi:hypothetical protein
MRSRPPGCIFDLVDSRTHLQLPAQQVANAVASVLAKALPVTFQNDRPKNETHLNDAIEGILRSGQLDDVKREHPSIPFGRKSDIADHGVANAVLIECKYPRKVGGKRSRGAIIDEIKSDLVSYSSAGYVLFVINDPDCLFADITELEVAIKGYPAMLRVVR